MVDSTIRIIVDPSGAVRGTRVVDSSLTKIRGAFKRTDRQVKTSRQELAGFGRSLTGALGIVGGLALLTSGFRQVITVGRAFTSTVSELSAITGATGQDLRDLAEAAKDIGRETTLGATAAAEGFKLIASAKPELLENRDALIEVTRAAVTLSEAAGIDLPRAVDALAGSLNQFNVDADQASRFINVLAAGAKKGSSEIPDLTQALRLSGVAAAALGLSFETTVTGLEVLAEAQIKGSEAGTQFRNVLVKLTQTGVKALDPAVVGLAGSLDNLNDLELSNIELLKIFGPETFTAAKALALRTDRIRELETGITDTKVAEEQARIATNNLDGDLDKLTNSFSLLGIEIFQISEPALRFFAEAGKSVLDVITDIVKAIPQTGLGSLSGLFGSAAEGFPAVSTGEVFGPPTAKPPPTRTGLTDAEIAAARAKLDKARASSANKAARETARTAVEQARSLASLTDQLRPLEAAQRESALAGQVLSRAFAQGTITDMEFRESLVLVKESLRDQLDPLGAINRELENERELIGLTSDQLDVENRVRDITNGLRQAGVDLSQQEQEALRGQVEELQRLNEAQARQQQLLEEIQGPANETIANLQALNDLYQSGAISANEFTEASEAQRLVLLDQSDSFADGVERGLIRANESIGDFADEAERGIARAFGGAEDTIAEFITTTELNFSGLVDSILQDLLRLAIRQAILAPLSQAFQTGGTGSAGSAGSGGSGGSAGSLFSAGLSAFAGSFQGGGSFVVPGVGGQDSRLVQLQATPGEEITVGTPGSRGGRTQSPPITFNFNISTPNPSSFRASQNHIVDQAGNQMLRILDRNTT